MADPPAAPRAAPGMGVDEPGRVRMDLLSDLLGFRRHPCGRGSKVRRSFLADLAVAVGLPEVDVDPPNGHVRPTKDELLDRIGVAVAGAPVPPAMHSIGGTITDDALDLIIEGVEQAGLRNAPRGRGARAARIAAYKATIGSTDADQAFDALDLSDERRASLRRVIERPGQASFRRTLIHAYGGRCVITALAVTDALEAAHIRPYRGPHSDRTTNGLLLRADLHRLWDRGLLWLAGDPLRVSFDPSIVDEYPDLDGRSVLDPAEDRQKPSRDALEQHRSWCLE